MEILQLNVRLPEEFRGDINSQIAACNVGRRRLQGLCAGYGHGFLLTVFDSLLDRSEIMTRDALGRIPSGEYRYTDYLDNDGINIDQRIQISVTAIIDDGEITFDLDQSSEQVDGPFNCVPSGSLSAACFAVRVLTGADIPTNGGCFRPIHMNSRSGPSSIPPSRRRSMPGPRPSSCIAGCMVSAFQKVLPEKVTADSASEMLILQFGGRHSEGGVLSSVS